MEAKSTLSRVDVQCDGAALAIGDAAGGKITFAEMGRAPHYSGWLSEIIVSDPAQQGYALDLVLFRESFTATADNAALAISAADAKNCIGSFSILASDWKDIGAAYVARIPVEGAPYKTGQDGNLYGQFQARGTATYGGAGTPLTVSIGGFQD